MEQNILHETENFYIYRISKSVLEIRLKGQRYAISLGQTGKGIDAAKKTVDRFEKNVPALRKHYGHY